MLNWVLATRIDKTGFLVPLYVAAAVLFVLLALKSVRATWLTRAAILVLAGAGTGLLLSWLVSDVWDLFGVALTTVVRVWIAMLFAGLFLAVGNLWRSRWWRKVLAVVAAGVFLLATGAAVNEDFGAYRSIGDALGVKPYPALPAADLTGHERQPDPGPWTAPPGMPEKGALGTVVIPATHSHFPARPASVYLPPAALTAHPPALPVLVMFPGQPGGPSDVFTSGRVAVTLNKYAAAHHGLAPIVVAPDQLGRPLKNPMCVDSPLGNSATYLTVDVPEWIRSHLNVLGDPAHWAVGGYSQGGTCATQFGFGDPQLFGSLIDILGERQPTIGPDTVAKAFGGSTAKYDAQKPLALLAAHKPYTDSYGIFGSGLQDKRYTRYVRTMDRAAKAAGMTTTLILSPHSGHDWNTVRYVLARALPLLADHQGLGHG